MSNVADWGLMLPPIQLVEPGLEITPAELDAVTGLTPEMQRVWRSRGHLAKPQGSQARYRLLETAQILIGYELSKWGILPSTSMKIALRYGGSVVQHAVYNVGGSCEFVGESQDVDNCLKAFDREDIDGPLVRYIAGNEDNPLANYLVSEDNLPVQPCFELPRPGDLTGIISLQSLDLHQAGIRLAERIGRPIVKVEVGKKSEWSRHVVRRLNGHRAGSP